MNSKYYDGIHTGFEFSLRSSSVSESGTILIQEDVPEKILQSVNIRAGINILFLGYFTGMREC